MAEQDALSGANFGSGLFLTDFPVKIRVLTLDPVVSIDNFANTRYAFVVFNLDLNKVQILNKGPGFAQRFKEIHADSDFGGDLKRIDLKITTNGKPGIEVRYTVTPIGSPSDLTEAQKKIIVDAKIDLEAVIKKNSPGALRLSEVNAGKEPTGNTATPESSPDANDNVVIEDLGDEPINLDDIPF